MPKRIYVRGPNWIGDVVMATPVLASLREFYPDAEIHLGLRSYARPVLEPCALVNEIHDLPGSGLRHVWKTGRRLRELNFDMAILLANSFGSALEVRLAGIPIRRGYAQDGRGWLLTDPILPLSEGGKRLPIPMSRYYARIIEGLGCKLGSTHYQLEISPEDKARAHTWLDKHGAEADRLLIGLNPGASFGSSKLWESRRFAALGDRITRELNGQVVLLGGPGEDGLLGEIEAAMETAVLSSAQDLIRLGPLKELVRQLDVLITTDTGPRAIAQAVSTPHVVLMGPTHPGWTDLNLEQARILRHDVDCGPCHKKVCDLDHRCMTQIETGHVFAAIRDLLRTRS